MQKPVLLIMAAGMGSRYGGCKQIDPMDDYGNLIIDFSLYDALRAGFEDVVFLIKRSIEADFREAIGARMEKRANVRYAFQELDKLPAGLSIPEGREKPYGTSHALICSREALGGRDFAAINADDYYGPAAYKLIFDFLQSPGKASGHALAGYPIKNTLTENGSVTRGVCEVQDGFLTHIVERFKIVPQGEGCAYLDEGDPVAIPDTATASMNFWGFRNDVLDFLEERFAKQAAEGFRTNPLKFEALLPNDLQYCIAEGRGSVRVLPTPDKWCGVTYTADKPRVMATLAAHKAAGLYPEKLWE